MTTTITAQNIELTLALKDYAEKRFNTLAKYVDENSEIVVEVSKTTDHHLKGEFYRAAATVKSALGKNYFASSEKTDIYHAIDEVRDELSKIVSSDKKKNESIWKKGARKIKDILKGLR